MKRKIEYEKSFKKDFKKVLKRGYDINKFTLVVDMLANDVELPLKYRDHALSGNYAGYRDCHITPDWLLIYKKLEDELILVLVDTGTHSDLF